MGGIIFWTIIRMAVAIPVIWALQGWFKLHDWWIGGAFLFYIFVLHPFFVQLRSFEEKNKDIINSTLCSSCRNFDKTAVLCIKYDQHPTRESVPCEGTDWEPIPAEDHEKEKYSS
ncbi:MAG: hypothetical protein ACM3Q2_01005 [Syntrophothermus sp.]